MDLREARVNPAARTMRPRRTYWLISRLESRPMEVLTLDLDGDAEVLPVFGLEEEAGMFLRLLTSE